MRSHRREAAAPFSSAPRPAHSAGVLVHDGAGRVLLGLHRDGWTSFAGKAEPGETPRQTALRECGEETLFVLGDGLEVEEAPALTSRTPSGRAFHMYAARLARGGRGERADAGDDVCAAFARARASGRYGGVEGCDETRELRWFEAHDLDRVRVRPSFRADLARLLEAARARAVQGATHLVNPSVQGGTPLVNPPECA